MIKIESHSGVYTLQAEQTLPVTAEQAWEFFSSPANLGRITPSEMGFVITSPPAARMFPGQIITYRVGIFPGVKTNWVTEITHVETGRYFVDEQRSGPYRIWHHEHHFKVVEGGVAMIDRVTYKLPFGVMGKWVHSLFVRRKLEAIFNYRARVIEEYFSSLS